MYSLFVFKGFYRTFRIATYLQFDSKISIQTLKVSAPLILQYVFSIGGWQVFYLYVEHLGVTQLAASHILRSVLGIVSIGTWALASTCNTMVSNIIGQGKQEQVLPLLYHLYFAISVLLPGLLYERLHQRCFGD
jgi:Na+-driven multidrug efflux pump